MADAEYPLPNVLRWRHVVRQLKHILHIRAYFHNLGEYLKQFAALKAPQKRRAVRWQAPPRDRPVAASAAAATPKARALAKATPKARASSFRCLPSSSSRSLEATEEPTEEWSYLGQDPDPQTSGNESSGSD